MQSLKEEILLVGGSSDGGDGIQAALGRVAHCLKDDVHILGMASCPQFGWLSAFHRLVHQLGCNLETMATVYPYLIHEAALEDLLETSAGSKSCS